MTKMKTMDVTLPGGRRACRDGRIISWVLPLKCRVPGHTTLLATLCLARPVRHASMHPITHQKSMDAHADNGSRAPKTDHIVNCVRRYTVSTRLTGTVRRRTQRARECNRIRRSHYAATFRFQKRCSYGDLYSYGVPWTSSESPDAVDSESGSPAVPLASASGIAGALSFQ